MPIKSISIVNFKSIRKIKLNFENNKYDLHCILGKNGVGKSNILDSIKYFYDNLHPFGWAEAQCPINPIRAPTGVT